MLVPAHPNFVHTTPSVHLGKAMLLTAPSTGLPIIVLSLPWAGASSVTFLSIVKLQIWYKTWNSKTQKGADKVAWSNVDT